MHYVNYINIWIIYLHGFCDGVSINVDYIFLLPVCISLAVDACQVNNFLWLSTAAKESYILGCCWPPRKVTSLAVNGRQQKLYPGRL